MATPSPSPAKRPGIEAAGAKPVKKKGFFGRFILFMMIMIILAAGTLIGLNATGKLPLDKYILKVGDVPFIKDKLPKKWRLKIALEKKKAARLEQEKAKRLVQESQFAIERKKLDELQMKLDSKERMLAAKEKELANKEAKILEENAKMISQQGQKTQEGESLQKLVTFYSDMKADAAAKIMTNLTDNLVIDIFKSMDGKKVAKIMAALDPKRAATLTQKMSN